MVPWILDWRSAIVGAAARADLRERREGEGDLENKERRRRMISVRGSGRGWGLGQPGQTRRLGRVRWVSTSWEPRAVRDLAGF